MQVPKARRPLVHYVLAVFAIIAAFILRRALEEYAGGSLPTYITFYPAVMIAALLAGFWAGFLATVVTVLITSFWILPPEGFAVGNPADQIGLIFFTGIGLFVSWLSDHYIRSRQMSAEYEKSLAIQEERQRSEEAVRKERNLLDIILNATDVMLVYLDPDFNFLSVNRAYADTCKMQPEEMIGRNHFEFYPNEENEAIFRKVRDTGEPVFFKDKPFTFPDQPERGVTYWDWSLSPVKDESGKVAGLVFTLRETTKYKKAEQALADSEERLRLATNAASEAIWDWNIGTDTLICNETYSDLFGRGPDDKSGQWFFDHLHPDDRDRIKDQVRAAITSTDDHLIMEYRLRRKDNTYADIYDRALIARDQTGRARRIVGAKLDITERKRALEEVKQRTAELESFSYTVSHDLRSPLRAIDGFSQMLLKDIGEKLDPESLRKFNVISSNAKKMGQLIDDLLGYSRMGRAAVSPVRIDMQKLIGDVWKELCAGNPDHHVELKITGLSPAWGDLMMIRQVMSNLLGNSVKFTRGQENANIEVSSINSGEFNTYCIKDNGVGFDMRFYEKLFEIFRRLHSEREFEGTGVGLAIVKKIIEKHGGRIWAESKPGEGATFCFTLPSK